MKDNSYLVRSLRDEADALDELHENHSWEAVLAAKVAAAGLLREAAKELELASHD